MNKRKICVVITARASYSRIRTLLDSIQKNHNLELQLIVSGSAMLSKYGDAFEVIEKDGFIINEKIFNVIDGNDPVVMAKSTGLAVIEIASAFMKLKPDIVITIADRYETLATSIAASYQNITLAHVQGGEVTGNIDEKVRHANTKLADIHFVATEDARERVIKLGESEEYVLNHGCPSIDIARKINEENKLNFDPIEKYKGVGVHIDPKDGYIVVLQHPVTTEYEKSTEHISETLNALDQLKIPTFMFWPNIDSGTDILSTGIRRFRENKNPDYIHFFKNMEPIDFLRLLKFSNCLVGNSSVGIRECSYLGVPVINIGSRQNGRKQFNNVINCDNRSEEIINAVQKQIKQKSLKINTEYGDGFAGEKISSFLEKCDLIFKKKINY